MDSVSFNLSGLYSIRRGADWDRVQYFLHEDYSGWTPKGQVRTDYLDRPNDLLAEFSFLPLSFATITIPGRPPFQATTIIPSLAAAQTKLIPTPPRGQSWVYDIFLSQGTKRLFVIGGTVGILPEVTDV